MAYLIDGKKISQEIKDELKAEVAELARQGKTASLAVIQVGADPASSVYVRNKKNACAYIGIGSESYELPEETSEKELLALIAELNHKEEVRGILVQLPLPAHINEEKVILAIDPAKDVDGFHPQSAGALMIGSQGFLPCTPAGVIQLLKRSDIEIEGKNCVVLGRSNIVGKPMAMLMLRENATVTITHSRTKDLREVCCRADILIVAIYFTVFNQDIGAGINVNTIRTGTMPPYVIIDFQSVQGTLVGIQHLATPKSGTHQGKEIGRASCRERV